MLTCLLRREHHHHSFFIYPLVRIRAKTLSLVFPKMRFQTLATLFAAVCYAVAAPSPTSDALEQQQQLDKREVVVNHDSLFPIAQSVRAGAEGNAILRYEPFLHIASGCQSYTAVDAKGDVSGGLDNTGSMTGGCADTTRGQTYARGAKYKGRYAIMYAWYFPKDQIVDGGGNAGHRHDWENVVVWIDDRKITSIPL
jgi:hypothetical protein